MWDEVNYWYYGDLSSGLQHKAWKNDRSWSQGRGSASSKPDLWNGHRHLHVWWLNLSDQLYRRRRERYRVFAARLAKKYGTIFMEDFNLRSVAETSARDGDAARYRLDRFQRSKAAVSVLRDAIKNACQREGVTLVLIGERHPTHVS